MAQVNCRTGVGMLMLLVFSCAAVLLLAIPSAAHASHTSSYNFATGVWSIDLGRSDYSLHIKLYDNDDTNPTKIDMDSNTIRARYLSKTLTGAELLLANEATSLIVDFEFCGTLGTHTGSCHSRYITPSLSRPELHSSYNSDTGSWYVSKGYVARIDTDKVALYDPNDSTKKIYMGLGTQSASEFRRTLTYDEMVTAGSMSSHKVHFEWCDSTLYCNKNVPVANQRPRVAASSFDSSTNTATITVTEPLKEVNHANICLVGKSIWGTGATKIVCATSASTSGKTVTASFGNECMEEYYTRIEVKSSALKDTANTWNADTYLTRSMHWFC